MTKIPQIHKLSKASQVSLLAVVILLGAIFFTVNTALQEQNGAGHASGTDCTSLFGYTYCPYQTYPTGYSYGYPTQTPYAYPTTPTSGQYCKQVFNGFTYTTQCYYPTPTPAPISNPTAIPPTEVPPTQVQNILSNPGCESGTTDFIGINATISKVSSPVHSGSAACKVVATGGSYYDITATNSYANPQAGQTFTGSAYVRAASNTGGQVFVALQEWNGSTLLKSTYGNAVSLTTSWQKVTNTTKFSSGGTKLVFYVVQDPGYASQVFYADDMTFSSGSSSVTPTTYLQPTPTCAPPPTCYRNGAMICMMPYNGWCGFTPTAVPPTALPTEVPSVSPLPSATEVPSNAPTSIPQPTDTPAPGSTLLAVNVGLHGIGNGGDSASPGSQGNMNPLRPTRTITADVYDTQNQLVVSQQGALIYDTTTGRFDGTINLGTNFQSGHYTVKIKTDQYLRALVPGIQNIAAGQTNNLPDVILIAGDINGDNAINIVDYNILIGCYSDLLPATDCNATNNILADLTDDGHVNQFDYNLFLRELTNIGGQ